MGLFDNDDAGGTSITLFGIYIQARFVGFLGLVYFTKILPPEQLDAYFLFYLIVQVASLVSNLGLSQALVRRISEDDRRSQIYSAGLVGVISASILAAAAFFTFRGPIAAYVGLDVPLFLSLGVALWLLSDVHLSSLQGEDRVLTVGLLQLFQDIVRVGVGAALISIGIGTIGLVYGVVIGFGITVIVAYPLSSLRLAIPAARDFRRLFDISRYTMFFGPTNFIYFWLDTFMIGLLLPVGSVAAYEVAWQTARILILANTAINRTIFPKVSRWANEGAFDEIERVVPGSILFSLVFPLPGVVGFLVLGDELLSVLYRPSYAYAAVPLTVLGLYMAVESLQRVSNTLHVGLDRADIPFRTRLVGVSIAVILNVTLIPIYGILGAAIATLTAKLVDAVMQWLSIRKLLTLDVPTAGVTWLVLSAGVMGVIVLGGTTAVSTDGLLGVIALVGLGVITYGFLTMLNNDIRQVIVEYVPFDIEGRLGESR